MPRHTTFFEHGLADLRHVLETSLLVRDIVEPLQSCGPDDDADTVRKDMEKSRFDIKGYAENGKVPGYVQRHDLRQGSCGRYRKSLVSAQKVCVKEPILNVLPRLIDKSWLFVEEDRNAKWIVTRADLQKAPVRMALFGRISLLEMHLLSMVRTCYKSDEEIERSLQRDQDQWTEVQKSFRRLRNRREESDLAACLSLSNKAFLICGVPDALRLLGFSNADHRDRVLKNANRLRNNLAHGHDLVKGTRWEVVAGVVKQIQEVLEGYESKRSEFERKFGAGRCSG